MHPAGVMEAVGGFFGKRDVDLYIRSLAWLRLDVEQTVYQFGAFAQVDHAQAAAGAFFVILCHGFHVKPGTVILDFQAGMPISTWRKRTVMASAAACLRALLTASSMM